MYDLLYVHPHHAFAPHILSYYHLCSLVPPEERHPWMIDPGVRLATVYTIWFFKLHNDNSQKCWLIIWPVSAWLVFCSDGMNGFIWLTERNGLGAVVPSPVNGYCDIVDNKTLWVSLHIFFFFFWNQFRILTFCSCFPLSRNVTYISPPSHKHVPRPPEGVVMPKRVSLRFHYCMLSVAWWFLLRLI